MELREDPKITVDEAHPCQLMLKSRERKREREREKEKATGVRRRARETKKSEKLGEEGEELKVVTH
jgi:hypothetical protein